MCNDTKKRLLRSSEAFKRRFADQPTAALDELLSAPTVARIVEEEVGKLRDRI